MGEKRKELKRLTFVSGGEIAEGVSKEPDIVKNQKRDGARERGKADMLSLNAKEAR